jgi:hypothetical protein
MYTCPLYTRCHTPILFTCIAVLSRLVVKGGWTCEIWIIGTNNKLPGGPRQTRKIQYRRELGKGSVLTEDKARMDVFARCCRKSRSSIYEMYMGIMLLFTWKEKDWDIMSYLYGSLIAIAPFISCLIVYFLCRLKINHKTPMRFFLNAAPRWTVPPRIKYIITVLVYDSPIK